MSEASPRRLRLGGAKEALIALGHDVVWGGDWSNDLGDETLLSAANAERRILVTLDKDFGELAVVRGQPHHGIVRLVGISARRVSTACQDVLMRYGDELHGGGIDHRGTIALQSSKPNR